MKGPSVVSYWLIPACVGITLVGILIGMYIAAYFERPGFDLSDPVDPKIIILPPVHLDPEVPAERRPVERRPSCYTVEPSDEPSIEISTRRRPGFRTDRSI